MEKKKLNKSSQNIEKRKVDQEEREQKQKLKKERHYIIKIEEQS